VEVVTINNVFVTKWSPDGSQVLYSTYLGGTNKDFANAIAVDAAGNAYITGFTLSKQTDPNPFPLKNPYQGTFLATGANAQETFITKLDPNGSSLIYSTYLGGTGGSVNRAPGGNS